MKRLILAAGLLLAACTTLVTPTDTPTASPHGLAFPQLVSTPGLRIFTVEVGLCPGSLKNFRGSPSALGCTQLPTRSVTVSSKQHAITVPLDQNELFPYCIVYRDDGVQVAEGFAPEGASSVTCSLP